MPRDDEMPEFSGGGENRAYASWFTRLLAAVLDQLYFLAVLGAGIGYAGMVDGDERITRIALSPISAAMLVAILLNVVVAQGRTGRSFGKRVLGLRLVDARSGQPVGVVRAVLRQCAHLLDLLPIGVGFLWPLWDPHGRTFADKLTRTVVIDNLLSESLPASPAVKPEAPHTLEPSPTAEPEQTTDPRPHWPGPLAAALAVAVALATVAFANRTPDPSTPALTAPDSSATPPSTTSAPPHTYTEVIAALPEPLRVAGTCTESPAEERVRQVFCRLDPGSPLVSGLVTPQPLYLFAAAIISDPAAERTARRTTAARNDNPVILEDTDTVFIDYDRRDPSNGIVYYLDLRTGLFLSMSELTSATNARRFLERAGL
ncbi:RDD family protein [Nocardia crassostreae]|uniref:RDD family protein n=1 Tax=Nocardia crassostreae TaxID=53428 RepID=UPI00082F6189|nr:RDD family protein [Nocardia crassostreae]